MGNCLPSRGSGRVSEEFAGRKEFSVQFVQDAGSGIMRVSEDFAGRKDFSVQYVQDGSGILRVKMVISKRELEAFLSDRCMQEKLLLPQQQSIVVTERYHATRRCSSGGWRPSLEGVPEVN